MRTLIVRGKPRDLYDVWVLLGSGTKIDYQLINKKLKLYKKTFDFIEFKRSVEKSKRDWETDLREFLPETIPFGDIKNTVIAGFGKNIRGRIYLTRNFGFTVQYVF